MEELKVISDLYDFLVWLTQHVEKFPRHHRHSLGVMLESDAHTILSLLIRGKYSHQTEAFLTDANIELEVLRFRLRLAKDLGILPVRSHGHAAKMVDEIGRQIGGWRRSRKGKS